MTIDEAIRVSRRRAGLTLRALARRAGTSHATLSAYEHGRTDPTTGTLNRVVAATGYRLDVTLTPLIADPTARGHELEAVLELAAHFPARHGGRLEAPVFGR